jgi:hypothetical protein
MVTGCLSYLGSLTPPPSLVVKSSKGNRSKRHGMLVNSHDSCTKQDVGCWILMGDHIEHRTQLRSAGRVVIQLRDLAIAIRLFGSL